MFTVTDGRKIYNFHLTSNKDGDDYNIPPLKGGMNMNTKIREEFK